MVFIIITLIKTALIAFVLLTTLAYLQWVERKVIAHVQVRMGPYRVGPHGLLQPLADVVKLITKEGVLPPHVNKFFYLLAPFLAVFMGIAGRDAQGEGAFQEGQDSFSVGADFTYLQRIRFNLQYTNHFSIGPGTYYDLIDRDYASASVSYNF